MLASKNGVHAYIEYNFLVSEDCELGQRSKQHHRQIFEMMKEKQSVILDQNLRTRMYFRCKCLVDSSFKFFSQLNR
jgi:hypothetical protein